jgi:intraflagellar transport protein 81
VARLRSKIEDLEGADLLVRSCRELRKAYDEYAKMGHSFREQERGRAQAEKELEDAMERLRNLSTVEEDVDEMLNRMTEDNNAKSDLLVNRLPANAHSLEQRIANMKRILSGDGQMMDAKRLETDVRRLREKVHFLEQRQTTVTINQGQDEDAHRVEMMRQQLGLVQKNRQELEAEATRLKSVLDEKQRNPSSSNTSAAAQPQQQQSQQGGKDQEKPLKGEELKKYLAAVRQKGVVYKKRKGEVAAFKAEVAVLARTEDVLKSRDAKIGDYLDDLARKKGVDGFELDKVSSQKAQLDEAKGQTLEQISVVVEEINSQIRAKKAQLQPQIKELQALRDEHRELSGRHAERKRDFDAAVAGAEAERIMAEQDVVALSEDVRQQETLYHLCQSSSAVLKAMEERARKERDFKHGNASARGESVKIAGEEYASYEDALMQRAGTLQQQARELQERQRYIKENLEPNRMQMTWLGQIEQLLEGKRRVYDELAMANTRDVAAALGGGHQPMMAQQTVLGVDRLVL